jgi:formylglycine-generating enzyme required for sulfatase activity
MKIGLIALIFSTFCLSTSLLSEDHHDTKITTVPTGMALIPAGEFEMGSTNGDRDEKPIHAVHLDAFYIELIASTL